MTPTPNAAVANAATSNLNTAAQMTSGTPNNTYGSQYSGELVSPLSAGQQGTINAGTGIANNGTGATASNLIGSYASAPAQSVSSNSIASNMSPYMNQYVMQALAPQLQQMDTANAATNQATDAQATASGAYGDSRTGIQQSTNAFNQNVAKEGVIGNAYNSAFNTAIGAGAQDSANQLTAGTTNANLQETALSRELAGANAQEGLQTQQLGAQTTANTLNAQDTAQSQAALTAQYNNWLQAQQSGTAGLTAANQTVAAGSTAMPASTSTVNTQPNNSGYALLGSLLGAGANLMTGGISGAVGSAIPGAIGPTSYGGPSGPQPLTYSDERLKEGIDEIGELIDGTPIFSYSYKADPEKRKHIGLMAQDIQKRVPDAVHKTDSGYLAVDYHAATALARELALAA
jgi:hypothetical protein